MLTAILARELAKRDVGEDDDDEDALEAFPPHIKTAIIRSGNCHARLRQWCRVFGVDPSARALHEKDMTQRAWYEGFSAEVPHATRWNTIHHPQQHDYHYGYGKNCMALAPFGELLIKGPRGGLNVRTAYGHRSVLVESDLTVIYVVPHDDLIENLVHGRATVFTYHMSGVLVQYTWTPGDELLTHTRIHDFRIRCGAATTGLEECPVLFHHEDRIYLAVNTGYQIGIRHVKYGDQPTTHLAVYEVGGRYVDWSEIRDTTLVNGLADEHYRLRYLSANGPWVVWWSTPSDRVSVRAAAAAAGPGNWTGASVLMLLHVDEFHANKRPHLIDTHNIAGCVVALHMMHPNALCAAFDTGAVHVFSVDRVFSAESQTMVTACQAMRVIDTRLTGIQSMHSNPHGTGGAKLVVVTDTDFVAIYDTVGPVRTVDLSRYRRKRRKNAVLPPKIPHNTARLVVLDESRLWIYEPRLEELHRWSFCYVDPDEDAHILERTEGVRVIPVPMADDDDDDDDDDDET